MAQFPNIFNCDLHSGPVSASIRQMYLGDIAANRVGVRVTDNGEAVALSGTCSGTAMLYNGGTVALTGVVDGNVAYVDLPAAVYSVEGPLKIFVTLTHGGSTTTLLEMRSNVTRTDSGVVIDPGTIIPSVAALISDIEDAVASIPADYSDLLGTIAPDFSSSTAYTAGQYVWYSGTLYRFTSDHAAGSWTGTDAIAAEIGEDVTDLKGALTSVLKEWLYAENATTGKYYGDANGTSYSSNTWAIFSTEIPIVAGRRYLYKKICPRFSWYRYTNSSGYLGDAVQSVNGYFDATEDGTIIVTTASTDIAEAIFTEYQEIYDAGEQKDLTGIKTDETLSSALLPANAKATGDALANCYNTDETEFLVNDYYKNAQIVSGNFIGANGVPSVSNSAKYAIVPVVGGDSYKLLMPGYTGGTQPGNIGVLVYAHSGSSDSFESFSEMTSGAYGDGQYFIFSVPAECNEIWFNVVLGSLDIEETAVVCKSIYNFSELDAMDGISELSGNKLVDDYARSKINASTDFRTSIYGLKIAVIGDSITEQTYWAKEGWFTKICNWANVTGQNLGESGDGFGQYDTKISLIASDVDMIGIASSFNDFQRIGTMGDVTDTGVNTICGKANDFFDALITAFPNVPIICYCEGPWGNYHYGVSASDEYVEKIGIICAKHGIPYYDELYTKGSALKPWITVNTQEYFKCDDESSEHYEEVNNVHPNSKGHVAIAHYLLGKFIENAMSNVGNFYMGGS